MKKFTTTAIAVIAFAFATYAQPGSIDPTFNPTDIGFGNGPGANSQVTTTSIQSNGKIIIGGGFSTYNGTPRNRIARLNADGTLDGTFNPGTGADGNVGEAGDVSTISIQSDGKIIIGGFFTSYNGTARNNIARLNTNGTLDGTFNPGTGASNSVRTISLQSDGKIIIGGGFTSYNGITRNRIARLNADGTIDATFNPVAGANSSVSTIYIQSDGKIIIGGQFTSYNGTTRNRIARLNTDGTLDGTFNPGSGATGENSMVNTTSIQSDGKIIIGGQFTSYNGITRNNIVRLNTNGTLDGTFNQGTGANFGVSTTSIQSDGKIVIGGFFTSYNGITRNRIARLNTNGTLDGTFNQGTGANGRVVTSSIQSDGKIVIGGAFTSFNGTARDRIARLNADGTIDGTFYLNPGTGANTTVRTISIQTDGKVIIGGGFATYNGTVRNRIARLNADGTVDGTFNLGTGANSDVNTTSIQSDGKIIIGGQFTSYNGTERNYIARLNAEGTLDGTFNPGTGANGSVVTTSIQSDGKIVIGGFFTSYNGITRNRIARLNADGTLDATFNSGTGTTGGVSTISLQSDGKIIIGGAFTSFNGEARDRIARLNTDGTLDATFNPGSGADSRVETISIQSDGKIIIGGQFTSYNGVQRNLIARLNADGALDGTFNPEGTGGLNDISSDFTNVYTTSIQSNGKIIIGGQFTSYNGVDRNGIARLNADGTLDGTFNPGTGTNDDVRTSSIQSDGKIIIGGDFTGYDGTGRNRIARINVTAPLNTTVFEKNAVAIYPNPTNSKVFFDNSNYTFIEVAIYNHLGQEVAITSFNSNINNQEIDMSGLATGVYVLRLYNATNSQSIKIIKQ
jgi:uncharacterized delta-60 repeat protein